MFNLLLDQVRYRKTRTLAISQDGIKWLPLSCNQFRNKLMRLPKLLGIAAIKIAKSFAMKDTRKLCLKGELRPQA